MIVKKIMLLFLILVITNFLTGCGEDRIAGGTEVGNPTSTAGVDKNAGNIEGVISFSSSGGSVLPPSPSNNVFDTIIAELENTAYSVYADSAGSFKLSGIIPDTYNLIVKLQKGRLIKMFSFPVVVVMEVTTYQDIAFDSMMKGFSEYEYSAQLAVIKGKCYSDGSKEFIRNDYVFETMPAVNVVPENIKELKIMVGNRSRNILPGETVPVTAIVKLNNDFIVDVTNSVNWFSSDPEKAVINSEGILTAVSEGNVIINAEIESLFSNNLSVYTGTKKNIRSVNIFVDYVQKDYYNYIANESIYNYLYTVIIGDSLVFRAIALFDDNSWKDITDEVLWKSSIDTHGKVNSGGIFYALNEGTTRITAEILSVSSNIIPVRVEKIKEIKSLYIYQVKYYISYEYNLDAVNSKLPWYYFNTILSGDTVQYKAMAEYNNGDYDDMTDSVLWESSDISIGEINRGVFTGKSGGQADVSASYLDLNSNSLSVNVVEEESVVYINVYMQPYQAAVVSGDTFQIKAYAYMNTDRYIDYSDSVSWSYGSRVEYKGKGVFKTLSTGSANIQAHKTISSNIYEVTIVASEQLENLNMTNVSRKAIVEAGETIAFNIYGYYNTGKYMEITDSCQWVSSNISVADFTSPGNLKGYKAGSAEVHASFQELSSKTETIRVWEKVSSPDTKLNQTVWSDYYNEVVLKTNHKIYNLGDIIDISYTIKELKPNWGYLSPRLNISIFSGTKKIITFQDEGVTSLSSLSYDELKMIYQTSFQWDCIDEMGNLVEPGKYTLVGRFEIYYDPVITLNFIIK